MMREHMQFELRIPIVKGWVFMQIARYMIDFAPHSDAKF